MWREGEGRGLYRQGRQLHTLAIGFDFSFILFIGGRGGVKGQQLLRFNGNTRFREHEEP